MSPFLTEMAGLVLLVTLVASGVKALASVLRTLIQETSCTRRLTKALEGSSPDQRPGIIKEVGKLEGRSTEEPGCDSAEETSPDRAPRREIDDV